MTGNLNMNNRKIIGLSSGTNNTDAVTVEQLNLKANQLDVYSKGVTDTLLNAKAGINTVYTKTEADARYYLNSVTLNSITAPGG